MVEKFYDNRNFKILKINKKTENISMLIIVLCTLCKSQYKNVGLGQYKNVGFPTFLYCLFSLHLL